jgi:predicted Rossmann-fold nucleotide-binding protein
MNICVFCGSSSGLNPIYAEAARELGNQFRNSTTHAGLWWRKTLEETAEILTWKQLGLIQQSVGILNVNRLFETLLQQMNLMVKEGFLNPNNLKTVKVSSSPNQLLSLLIP